MEEENRGSLINSHVPFLSSHSRSGSRTDAPSGDDRKSRKVSAWDCRTSHSYLTASAAMGPACPWTPGCPRHCSLRYQVRTQSKPLIRFLLIYLPSSRFPLAPPDSVSQLLGAPAESHSLQPGHDEPTWNAFQPPELLANWTTWNSASVPFVY